MHEFDASGLSCTLCGYQRIKVSFDPGEGSGVMEDVYLAKGETFTLPANAFVTITSSPRKDSSLVATDADTAPRAFALRPQATSHPAALNALRPTSPIIAK